MGGTSHLGSYEVKEEVYREEKGRKKVQGDVDHRFHFVKCVLFISMVWGIVHKGGSFR